MFLLCGERQTDRCTHTEAEEPSVHERLTHTQSSQTDSLTRTDRILPQRTWTIHTLQKERRIEQPGAALASEH